MSRNTIPYTVKTGIVERILNFIFVYFVAGIEKKKKKKENLPALRDDEEGQRGDSFWGYCGTVGTYYKLGELELKAFRAYTALCTFTPARVFLLN